MLLVINFLFIYKIYTSVLHMHVTVAYIFLHIIQNNSTEQTIYNLQLLLLLLLLIYLFQDVFAMAFNYELGCDFQ